MRFYNLAIDRFAYYTKIPNYAVFLQDQPVLGIVFITNSLKLEH